MLDMAGPVINLCSSPEPQLPPHKPVARAPTIPSNSKAGLAAKNQWIDLSSDSLATRKPISKRLDPANDWLGGVGLSSSPLDLPPSKPAPKSKGNGEYMTGVGSASDFGNAAKSAPTKPTATTIVTKSGAAQAAKNHWANLPSLSSDKSSPMSTKNRSVLKPISNLNTSSKPSGTHLKGGADFVFLDDDFDTTILSDDPFASPPPAKRIRLSSSPKAAPRPNASGYRRSVSNVGPSSKAGPSAGHKRSTSNTESLSKAANFRPLAGPSLKMTKALELDPLEFTSSPDYITEAAKKRKKKRTLHLDVSDFEDISDAEPKRNEKGKGKGKEAVLANFDLISSDLEVPDVLPNQSTLPSKLASKHISADAALAKYEAWKAKDKAAQDNVDKVKERTEKSKSKKEEKEAEKERKKQEREEKAREKDRAADLARVNILKTDKKKSTEEMIVDLPSCLEEKLAASVHNFLTGSDVKVQHTKWQSELPLIKWRRKVVAEFNFEQDLWEPVAPRIDEEKHIMCILNAKEFVELVIAEEGKDLDCHVLNLQTKFEGKTIIYLIEGMTTWFRKNRNIKDKQFKDAVRSHGNQDPTIPPTATQKRKKKEEKYIDEDKVEEALLKLQMYHNALIHHTNVMIETAEWIWTFTQHISTIPYKSQKNSLDAAFCMDSGQVKTGENAHETYVKMLQEIVRITASIAYGIATEYPTVQKLVEGLKKKGPLALEDCEKVANKDGAFSGKRVGPAISRRVYKVFLGRDPGSWDV